MRALAVLVLAFFVSCTVAFAQPADTAAAEQPDQQKEMAMYAMLEPTEVPEPGPLAKLLQRVAPGAVSPRLGPRPMVLWQHWANQRKPFFPSLLILLFTSITISSLIPRWTQNAQGLCKKSFWKTFLIGILGIAVAITAIRGALLTMIGWPLAVLVMAVMQLAVVSGLAVMIVLLGQSIGSYMKVDKWIARPDVRRLFCILIGCIVCAALLQIAGVAMLPRIGTRLVAMLAVVGFGGLLRSRGMNPEAP